jgi:hypothetical protein
MRERPLGCYLSGQSDWLVNYAERYRAGLRARRLAIFASTFDLAASVAVVASPEITPSGVVDDLTRCHGERTSRCPARL